MDEDRHRSAPEDEAPTREGEASATGGASYTGRPSAEEPEEGGPTRDESRERPDHSEGREETGGRR